MDLSPLVQGLLYPSEDDRPFDVIDGPATFDAAGLRPCARSEVISIADFFEPLRGTADAERFAMLRQALTSDLVDLRVTRVCDGSAEVHIYVIGRTRDGRWAGVHTVSVET
jgi:hypothetical protein